MSSLPDNTRLGMVTLTVADLDRALQFYVQTLGFEQQSQESGAASVGAGGVTLLRLIGKPGAKRQPRFSTGLYHVAILLPSQVELARLIMHLAQVKYPLSGYADHLVSEAFYLNDPDGNGLELYRDRPRSEWPKLNGQIQMASDPINFDLFFAEAEREAKLWAGMPAGTTVGHMHLKVGDTAAAERFYSDVIGFDRVVSVPGASFVSAGGYHHHVGMNQWESKGAPPAPEDAAGLREWTIILPSADDLEAVADRLEAAGAPVEPDGADLIVTDPWHNRVRITNATFDT